MKITIAHFYYDLLNLYGESGNVKALQYQLEQQGFEVSISFITIDDVPNFKKYDVIYIGSGTEENQKLALKHLMKYQKEIYEAILNNTFFIATGNAIELFGRHILDRNKKKIKALSICNFSSKQEEFRIVDEVLATADFLSEPIIGFQNQGSVIKNLHQPMFKIIKGAGSYPNSHKEGIHYHNFYGSYLIGPLLIRNPHFLQYLVTEIIQYKKPNYKIKPFSLELEEQAYQSFIQHHYADIQTKTAE